MAKESTEVKVFPQQSFLGVHKLAFKISFFSLLNNFFRLILFFTVFFFAISSFILIPFALLAFEVMVHSLIRNGKVDFEYIVSKLKMNWETYFGILVATALSTTIIIAGLSLLIVPGIILGYALSPLYYVLLTSSSSTGGEAVMKSIKLMNGHKLRLYFHRLFSVTPMIIFITFAFIITSILGLGNISAIDLGEIFSALYFIYYFLANFILSALSLYFILVFFIYVRMVDTIFYGEVFAQTLEISTSFKEKIDFVSTKKWVTILGIFFLVPPLLFTGINLVLPDAVASSNLSSMVSNNASNSVQGTSAVWSISNSTYAARFFRPTVTGFYEIYTTGNNDTYGCLYNNVTGNFIACDDDSGFLLNFYIEVPLSSDFTYVIEVFAYEPATFNLFVNYL
jgi:hypothetical protein